MDIFRRLAEERIREAMERGEFDELPGSGRPLMLADDSRVPEEMRMAFHVLKNSGCLPPEMELKKEIFSLGELLRAIDDEDRKVEIRRQIDFKILKFNLLRKTPFHLDGSSQYRDKIIGRLAKGRSEGKP